MLSCHILILTGSLLGFTALLYYIDKQEKVEEENRKNKFK